MINKEKLSKVLIDYKRDFLEKEWPVEKYKWEAIQCFQKNWDVEAEDFTEMLDRSLSKTGNLLANIHEYPRTMILEFASAEPETVRSMFLDLFDESRDLWERVQSFKDRSDELLKRYKEPSDHHFQNEHTISIYLWLCYPDKYYIYKYSLVKQTAEWLDPDHSVKRGAYAENLQNALALYDEICEVVQADTELVSLFRSLLTESCYPDPELRTLAHDISMYISRTYSKKSGEKKDPKEKDQKETPPKPKGDGVRKPADRVSENESESEETQAPPESDTDAPRCWWVVFNPKVFSLSAMPVGGSVSFSRLSEIGRPRRVTENFEMIQPGDFVIGYESGNVRHITALGKILAVSDDGFEMQKTENLIFPIDRKQFKDAPELAESEFIKNPRGTLFRLNEEERDFLLDLIREENSKDAPAACEAYTREDFLKEVYLSEAQFERMRSVLARKKNLILQGAPGVGKTFAARRLAWAMMGEKDDSRIEFVQFHQNYSYEDFVMGYRPDDEGFALKPGIFHRFCRQAQSYPDQDFFLIIDEINRGNISKIFGELLMLIEKDYRGVPVTLAYSGDPFTVPENLYIIGMMNTADRSLAMIDYALRRRFSFIEMNPGFDSEGFRAYRKSLDDETFDALIDRIRELNRKIAQDSSLGRGFRIGHSYFCNQDSVSEDWLRDVVDFDILPMLEEYWFDEPEELRHWENQLHGVFAS